MKKLTSAIRQPLPRVAGVATLLAIGVLWAACTSTPTAADELAKSSPVQLFYADAAHCMYMFDYPADVAEIDTNRYAKAADAAVLAMRQAQASLSQDQALLQLRDGCASVLER